VNSAEDRTWSHLSPSEIISPSVCVTATSRSGISTTIESKPEVPDGEWFKDFGSFKWRGEGEYPEAFLLPAQAATGKKL